MEPPDLSQGILLINRVLQISRGEEKADGSYALQVEGVLSEDYFKARDALYSHYKVL